MELDCPGPGCSNKVAMPTGDGSSHITHDGIESHIFCCADCQKKWGNQNVHQCGARGCTNVVLNGHGAGCCPLHTQEAQGIIGVMEAGIPGAGAEGEYS